GWGMGVVVSSAPPAPPASLPLGSAQLLLSQILTPLSGCSCCCAAAFPLLKPVIPEALPPSPMGSALASGGSLLEPAGLGSTAHGGASSSFSQKPPL
ncbi:unnamed protein product, partial [Bubo scandiacus]